MRSLVLIAAGGLPLVGRSKQTNFVFINVLAQIGLGYTFVFLLLGRSPAVQLGAALAILAGYWLLFALYPLPGAGSTARRWDSPTTGRRCTGFFAHWDKNTNAAAAFDRWFLNLFPRPAASPFRFNEGGYATLNFVPSIATMIFGVLAGELLRERPPRQRESPDAGDRRRALPGRSGPCSTPTVCPIVKRIWTPSWAIYSTGWACWMLAFFYGVIDVAGFRRWAFPLVVVGVNSIAMYVMAQLMKPFVASQLEIHLGRGPLRSATRLSFEPMVESIASPRCSG